MTVDKIIEDIKTQNPHQSEFIQAVEESLTSLKGFINDNPKYLGNKLLYRITEPERVIMFRVVWRDDLGNTNVNRGYRVQFNSAIGPYKGGLRFHPSVNLSILKFLGFEQTFKNSLTGLPLGGAKGGSDFDPKGKSDSEIMSFCQAFMNELYKHIGAETDIPAGDIGVGPKEIGYLFGQYKKLTGHFNGTLTGKSPNWGGSFIRPEATGYGLIYFVENMLKTKNESLEKKTIVISGSGNVAQYSAEKAIELGAKVLSMSDSDGTIHDTDGIDRSKLEFIMDLKNNKRGRISEYTKKYKRSKYLQSKKPWGIKADIALPCATQNEINLEDAKDLIKNKTLLIAEGANMPTTNEAIKLIQSKSNILFAPSKAANAGGVAVSGLEMSQNSTHTQWGRTDVDLKLKTIMYEIHEKCLVNGRLSKNKIDYVQGANIAGFKRVAEAMMDQGLV